MSRIDYGLSTYLYTDLPLVEAARRAAAAGFRRIEGWSEGAHLDPRLEPDLDAIRTGLRDAGVEVDSIHLPFRGQPLGGDEALDEWLSILGDSLRIAGTLGTPIATLHSSTLFKYYEGATEKESAARVAEWVERLADIAATLGIRIAVENQLVGHAPAITLQLSTLAEFLTDPRIGFCLDTGHAIMAGVDCAQEISAAGERLIALHLNSNSGSGADVHWIPDQGVLDWPRLKQTLLDANYQGLWTLEVKGTIPADDMLQEARAFVERA